MLELDHIVIVATTLEQGVFWTEQKLGVKLQTGGKHSMFGTHNALLRLDEKVYLEVLAIDPDAPTPTRARWFGMDYFSGEPKLIHWVARSQNLEPQVQMFPELGRIISASRGDLHWQITVPDDGHLNSNGLIPTLIRWQGIHPTTILESRDCKLIRLSALHPEPEHLKRTLEQLGILAALEVSYAPTPQLIAIIQTPQGEVEL
jgi:hypothetical protein